MQFEKAHLSQSNRIGACFFGQQGMPSAICMASSSAEADVMLALEEGIAAIKGGAAGPITTPTAIPNAKNQRMTARSFMVRKIPQVGRIEKPSIPISEPVSGRLHHALVMIDAPLSPDKSLSSSLFSAS